MTGYLETAEILGNYGETISEIVGDLRGLAASLSALASASADGACIPASAFSLAAQQAHMMSESLGIVADYVQSIEEEAQL